MKGTSRGSGVRQIDGRRDVALLILAPAVGVGFNLLRLQLGLDRDPLAASLTAFWLLAGVSVLMARSVGMGRRQLGLALPRPMPAIVGGCLAASVLIGAALATAPMTRTPASAQLVGGLALFGLGTAPAEEFLFRGVFFGLVQQRAGAMVALVTSSLTFSVAHAPVYGVASLPLTLTAGLMLGWLRWWSGSLLVPWMVHVAADLSLLWL